VSVVPPGGGTQAGQQTIQGITSLTSNTITILNELGVQNTAAISLMGDAAILVASAASENWIGAAAAAVGIISQIIALLDPQSGQNPQLQQIQTTVNQIYQGDAQTAQINRIDYIQGYSGAVQNAAGSLQDLKNNPPPTSQVSTLMGPIGTAMAQLEPADVSGRGCSAGGTDLSAAWLVASTYQTFWTDADADQVQIRVAGDRAFVSRGYGQQVPPNTDGAAANTGGEVFNYTYSLPAYLYAVSTFASTGALIDPTFLQDWSNDLELAACLLQSVHDYIYNTGMIQLSPSPLTYQNLQQWLSETSAYWSSEKSSNLPPLGIIPEGTYGPNFSIVAPYSVGIEYGWVEQFSGYSSVWVYPLQEPFVQSANYDGAFQIRLLASKKAVYVGTGLKSLQNTINGLYQMTGQSSSIPTGPGPGDWSVRNEIAGPANVTRADGTLHLSDVMAYLKNTPPCGGPEWQAITSLQTALSGLTS
jgi:hypothetical protein